MQYENIMQHNRISATDECRTFPKAVEQPCTILLEIGLLQYTNTRIPGVWESAGLGYGEALRDFHFGYENRRSAVTAVGDTLAEGMEILEIEQYSI